VRHRQYETKKRTLIYACDQSQVWVAILMGDNIGIPQSVMGLTILAMGTSVPDMIRSVQRPVH
jgi:Ca2+/Na+ antiporter